MSTWRVMVCVTGVLLLAGVAAPAAGAGGKPVFERITVDDAFVDEELSEACGVAVTGTAQGHVTLRTFPGEGPGLATVNTSTSGSR